ncbi:protein phosphatase 2C domain-containing protein [Nonomuraea sp. NPDC049758]|uniref:protein phosphatase 2C domain-containing protein n=1 Tax=Nonomuraea sp. NPDC049758 TaxID=3154360 RepID=UPI0034463C71
MFIVDKTESPGSSHKHTEDRVGFSGNIAWVIDGATDPTNSQALPALSDVQWLVDFLHERLTEMGASHIKQSASALIEQLGTLTEKAIAAIAPRGLDIYPCSSIGIAICDGDVIHLGRIGDATLIAYHDGHLTHELSTSFFESREAQAVSQSLTDRQTESDIVQAMLTRRLEYIRGEHSETVFSGHPERSFKVYAKTLSIHDVDEILMCTDGFARAVVDYAILPDWLTLKLYADALGLASVTSRIRDFEAQRTRGERSTKFKHADDLAAIKLEVTKGAIHGWPRSPR